MKLDLEFDPEAYKLMRKSIAEAIQDLVTEQQTVAVTREQVREAMDNFSEITFKVGNLVVRARSVNSIPVGDVSVAVEEILKPKYMNDTYTWKQVKDAIAVATN